VTLSVELLHFYYGFTSNLSNSLKEVLFSGYDHFSKVDTVIADQLTVRDRVPDVAMSYAGLAGSLPSGDTKPR
jgi:hypothetical protein